MRATVSEVRSTAPSCSPTASSTRSPMACPKLSLICLKWSMSTKNTAVQCRERLAAASDCSMRSISTARLGNPVSASWVACRVSRACASCNWASRSACICCRCAISLSCAFCAVRSVKVRQLNRLPSTSSGEIPTSTGTERPALSISAASMVMLAPSCSWSRSGIGSAPPTTKSESGAPITSSRERPSSVARRALAYRISPGSDRVAAPSRMFWTNIR